jgi:hypothetical protein
MQKGNAENSEWIKHSKVQKKKGQKSERAYAKRKVVSHHSIVIVLVVAIVMRIDDLGASGGCRFPASSLQ